MRKDNGNENRKSALSAERFNTLSINHLGTFPKFFITPYTFMIIITKSYRSVQKIMKMKYFGYFLMCSPMKLDRDYVWSKLG